MLPSDKLMFPELLLDVTSNVPLVSVIVLFLIVVVPPIATSPAMVTFAGVVKGDC